MALSGILVAFDMFRMVSLRVVSIQATYFDCDAFVLSS